MFFLSSLYVLLICVFFFFCINAQNNSSITLFKVGVVLDLDSLVGRIGMTSLSLALSDYYSVDRNYTAKLVLHVRDSNGQVINAALCATDYKAEEEEGHIIYCCKPMESCGGARGSLRWDTQSLSLLKDEEVDAIIGPQKSAQSTFVIGLADRANVPVISFSATSPSLHPQTHYFVQATIIDSIQVGAIVDVVKYFNWSQVVIINEESDYGNGINPYLSNALQDANARVSHRSLIPSAATDDFVLQELYKMKTMQTRVFVVHISSSLASKFFPKVKEAGMMSKGYVWIVTSGLMDLLYSLDSDVVESMEGVIGVKPLIPRSKRLGSTAKRWKKKFIHDNPNFLQAEFGLYGIWAYDALWALAIAAERVQFTEQISSLQNTSFLNSTDRFTTNISKKGPKLQEALLDVSFQGLGGKFHLVNGQLESSSFQILNVVGKGGREVGIWTRPDKILSEENVNITSSSRIELKSIVFPGDTTAVPKGWEVPVSGKKLRVGVPVVAGFKEFVRVEKDPQTNVSKVSGCYIDMFDAVMAELPYAVPYEYIPFGTLDDSGSVSYDELCFQVFLKKYDAAVGDFTATSKRSDYVDFTLPFVAGGITAVKLDDINHDKWFFLRPFERELWLTTIAFFIFTGLVIWILEHRLNNAYRGPPAQHTGMIFYFAFMSLAFAQRERIVSNLARFVVVVWMFVVLILTSTYTAYLSARVTLENLEPHVSHPNPGDKVGCRNGSFIIDFLQKSGYKNVTAYNSARDINEALVKGNISAFFSVKPYTDLFLSYYPNKYKETDKTSPSEGFAYVFEKGSPLVADVSRAVIKLTDNGRLLEIKQQWIKEVNNEQKNKDSFELAASLEDFKALYGISVGIVATCLLVFIATYLYTNRDFVQRISNSNTTFWSKARAIGKHFDQRDPKSFRSSKYREDGVDASPSTNENTRSSTVVPISTTDFNDANGDTSPNSEHTASPNLQTR
ncbi:hypothetical protein RD792_014086 [Penstemon davidsonii]|uniref:Glutamate receptor n=1 Tax=Penstemon davidsonii TaxID=160366 RepID=A0ABR0CQM4_9LAMI|nr:hypothetical protein RD792_014086 [Penstemon davidsonii]